METVAIILLVSILIFTYFLPAIIGRNNKQATAIFAFNLLLGWSFIGWILALVWALIKDNNE